MIKRYIFFFALISFFFTLYAEDIEAKNDVFSRTFMTINPGLEVGEKDGLLILFDASLSYQRMEYVYSLQYISGVPAYFLMPTYEKGIILKHKEINLTHNYCLFPKYDSNNIIMIGYGAGLIIQTTRDERISYENWSEKTEYLPCFPIQLSFNYLSKKGVGLSFNTFSRIYEKGTLVGCTLGLNISGVFGGNR